MTPPRVKDRTVLVVGLARSGVAAAALFARHGARVIGVDDDTPDGLERRWQEHDLAAEATQVFADVVCGPSWHTLDPAGIDAVVQSPGVALSHPALVRLREAGVPVAGELEWAARFLVCPAVAVTGTNGKSTTTAWLAHALSEAGYTSPAVGNLGTPLSAVADSLPADAWPVVECSSFQLETLDRFRPAVGLMLNLAPDHLDRYPDVAAYAAAKARLAVQVRDDGHFVTWTGCPEALAWPHKGARLLFGDAAAGAAVWLDDGRLRARWRGGILDIAEVADLRLQSPPNLLNALATVAAALPIVPDPAALGAGLRSFAGLAHRHQEVGRLGRVRFVDDSKATNVHAACAALRGYPQPVVLIAGGSGKGEDYAPLREAMGAVVHVVTIGREGPAIAAALAGAVPTTPAADLPQAVALAARLAAPVAAPQATVLLSPACASFDMFSSYRQRGEVFAAAARALGARQE